MDRLIKEQYIVSLIVKERLGTLREEEKEELEYWLQEDEEHREAYDRLIKMKIGEEVERYRHLDSNAAWKKYKTRYSQKSLRKITHWVAVAASIVIVSSIFLLMQPDKDTTPLAVLKPGSSKAVLVLEDGSKKDLTREHVLQIDKLKIKSDGNLIVYQGPDPLTNELKVVYNELHIPIGGEYQLILADGTHVWLNSQTSLRYPVKFVGGAREVYLEGEAYFEVTHDETNPFRVKTLNGVKVEVLGTSFNVRAYSDEGMVETVLEEGSVKMGWKETDVILKPGMRGVYDQQTLKLDSVNTELYTAWHTGTYIFQNETLENLLYKLSRWYDVQIFFQDEMARKITFSGYLQKYDSIQTLLEVIELSGGVHFEIKGNTVLIGSSQ